MCQSPTQEGLYKRVGEKGSSPNGAYLVTYLADGESVSTLRATAVGLSAHALPGLSIYTKLCAGHSPTQTSSVF